LEKEAGKKMLTRGMTENLVNRGGRKKGNTVGMDWGKKCKYSKKKKRGRKKKKKVDHRSETRNRSQ